MSAHIGFHRHDDDKFIARVETYGKETPHEHVNLDVNLVEVDGGNRSYSFFTAYSITTAELVALRDSINEYLGEMNEADTIAECKDIVDSSEDRQQAVDGIDSFGDDRVAEQRPAIEAKAAADAQRDDQLAEAEKKRLASLAADEAERRDAELSEAESTS